MFVGTIAAGEWRTKWRTRERARCVALSKSVIKRRAGVRQRRRRSEGSEMKQRYGRRAVKALRGGRCINERIRAHKSASIYICESDSAGFEICVGSISCDCNYRISVRRRRCDRIRTLNLLRVVQSRVVRVVPTYLMFSIIIIVSRVRKD